MKLHTCHQDPWKMMLVLQYYYQIFLSKHWVAYPRD
jgi:hypothetical protein